MEAVNEMRRAADRNPSTVLKASEEVPIDRIGAVNQSGQKSHRTSSRNFQREKKVKNRIIATAVTTLAAIGILVLGCGPQPGSPDNQSGKGTQLTYDRTGTAASEDILGNAERAAYVVIGNQIMQGLATGADLSAALQHLDEARQALEQIDEAARAVQVVIGNQIMQGLADGYDLKVALHGLDQQRQSILNEIGLVQ